MEKIYVLYDSKCQLCIRLKNWILVQRCWIGVAVVAQGSEKARRLFPELDRIAGSNDLAVVSDQGEVYLNNNAWILVLHATVEYRDWAARLAHPLLLPLARQAFEALSRNRHFLSRFLRGGDPLPLAEELANVELGFCPVPEQRDAISNRKDALP